MGGSRLHRVLAIAAFALALAICAGGVWRYGYVQALGQLQSRAQSDLRLASDRLTRNLQRFQDLVVVLAEHPKLTALHQGGSRAAADALLLEAADKFSARNLMYVDQSGHVLAAAHGDRPVDLVRSPYLTRAFQGALGAHHDVGGTDHRRSYYFAAPGFDAQGQVQGALVVIIDVEEIEFEWRGGRPAVFFADQDGIVFVSNRTEMLLWTVDEKTSAFRNTQGAVQARTVNRIGPYELWRINWGPYLPRRSLHVTLPLPVIGLTGEALVDVTPALRLAGLQAAVFAALSLAAGAMLLSIAARRRVLAEQNAVLEARVTERTEELRRAQADLVQAGKLGALGQMSAGISHELNQPLMAIRSFAENSAVFLERGNSETVASNLTRISELSRRMGRIIKNLRAFARNESEEVKVVDLGGIIAGALDLSASRMHQQQVALDWTPPDGPVLVHGGEVRLGQVVLNLITNACDAMAGQSDQRLTLTLRQDRARTRLTVADTGPGITAPDKIFEPFYTTKEVGASEGMGLGLSISYGLVQSFGGDIRGENGDHGGAVFTIELESAEREMAA